MRTYILLLLVVYLQTTVSQIVERNNTITSPTDEAFQKFGISSLHPPEIPQQTRRVEHTLANDTVDTTSCICIDCYRAVVINFYEVYVKCPPGDFVDVSINIQSDMFTMNVVVSEFVYDSVYYTFNNVTCLNVDGRVTANTAAVNITCLQSALCTIQNAVKFTCIDATLLATNAVLDDNNTTTTFDSTNKTVVIVILIGVIALLLFLLTCMYVYYVSSFDDEE